MTYHLYCIIIIIQFYIFFPIFLEILRNYNNNIILSLSIIINIIVFYNGSNPNFFATYISYFIMGMYLAFNYSNIIDLLLNIRNKVIIISIGILITIYYIIDVYLTTHFNIVLSKYGITYYIFCLLTIPMYYVLCLYIYNSENNICRMFKDITNRVSKVSFSIYFIHPLIIIIIERVLRGLPIFLKYGVMTVVLIAISFIYANLSYKNKLKSKK